MARLSIPMHHHSRFTVCRENGKVLLVAEASDFNGTDLERRVYDDACDTGFGVQGKKRTALFTHERCEYDDEGELQVIVYTCDSERDVEVHILND